MKYERQVIDSHYHIYGWFDGQGRDFYETTRAYADSRGYAALSINALPSVEWDVSSNIIAALCKYRYPDFYAHGGLIYDVYPVPEQMPSGMDPLTQYRELMEIGFDGIKMLETKPTQLKVLGRPICDPLYEPFFQAIEEDGTHVLWHVADPADFWEAGPEFQWGYADGSYPTQKAIYDQVLSVFDRHPHLKATLAHFFFLSEQPERLEQLFERYQNVNVDMAPGVEMYLSFNARREYYRDFFIRHADRIQFATDCSDEVTDDYNQELSGMVYDFLTSDRPITNRWVSEIVGLNLPEEALRRILRDNFRERVSDAPRSINPVRLKAYIQKYRHLIRDERVRALIDAEAERL